MEVRQLKIIRISKVFLIIEDGNKVGSIHISEVGKYYIKSLEELFEVGDTVYGVLIDKEKKYYSLKVGHTIPKFWLERGGGFLGLKDYIEKFEKGE